MSLIPVRFSLLVSMRTADFPQVAFYGLEVPAGDIIVPAVPDFPATVCYHPSTAA
jgi:hypothetical protein